MKLDSDELWQYSLNHYSQIEKIVLPLQDTYGLNINLLLLCGYAQSHGCAIDEFQLGELMAQTGSWQQQLTEPFRQLRRELKSSLSPLQYQAMLSMELALEKEQQWRLINSLPELPTNNPEAQANILSCLISSGVALECLTPECLATLFSIGHGQND